MTELVHADIFFFITTVTVVVLGTATAVVLYYVFGIVRDLRAVMAKVRKASDELEQDFENLRANLKSEGVRTKTVFELLLGFLARQIPKARVRKGAKEAVASED